MGLVKNSLQKEKRHKQQKFWYKNWFSTSFWWSTLLPGLLGPVLGLILLISFGPWSLNRLTNFIKSQIDSSLTARVHYHRLAIEEEADDNPAPARPSSATVPAPAIQLDFCSL